MTSRKKHVAAAAPRRVVVALRMAGIAGQDKLNGIFDYFSAGRRWQLVIYRTKHEFTADVVKRELALGTDGFIVGIRTIVHRESTVAQSEAGKLVQRVLAYIERAAVRGIGVEDVARRFNVSRSLLEMRFR